jgi:hypothetical protein
MVRRYDYGACGSWETIDDVAQSYVEISGFAYIVLQYGVWSLEYSEYYHTVGQ